MKTSKLAISRMPTPEEWSILNAWRKANPTLVWRRGDTGPDGRRFYKYARESINGERWLSHESFEKTHARDIASNAEERSKDRESYNRYIREHRLKNLDRTREQSRKSAAAYRKRNKAKIAAKNKEEIETHRERKREWRTKNREKCRKQGASYRKKRPDICAASDAQRRGVEAQIKNLSEDEQKSIRSLYKFRDILNARHGKIVFHIDHIIPVSKGGTHRRDNLRITTADYNLRKSNL